MLKRPSETAGPSNFDWLSEASNQDQCWLFFALYAAYDARVGSSHYGLWAVQNFDSLLLLHLYLHLKPLCRFYC